MTPMTCAQVDLLLELYVTKDLGAEEARAIAAHLEGCPSCSASLGQARQLMDLLDLHYQIPVRLERLQLRLRQESQPRRFHSRSGVQKWIALAAMILVTFGLSDLLFNQDQASLPGLLLVSQVGVPETRNEMFPKTAMVRETAIPVTKNANLAGLDLKLTLVNSSQEAIRIEPERGLLQFTLIDPDENAKRGILVVAFQGVNERGYLIQPGQRLEMPIKDKKELERLVQSGRPGEYLLLLNYTVPVGQPGSPDVHEQVFQSPPLRFSAP